MVTDWYYRHPFIRRRTVEYECGNERSIFTIVPDTCPRCGAGVKARD